MTSRDHPNFKPVVGQRMNHLHQKVELADDDLVEVTLDGRANVMLLDPGNYDRYQRGEAFRYLGGLAERSPAVLAPTHSGSWYVVVDLGGYPGHVRAGIQVRQGSNAKR